MKPQRLALVVFVPRETTRSAGEPRNRGKPTPGIQSYVNEPAPANGPSYRQIVDENDKNPVIKAHWPFKDIDSSVGKMKQGTTRRMAMTVLALALVSCSRRHTYEVTPWLRLEESQSFSFGGHGPSVGEDFLHLYRLWEGHWERVVADEPLLPIYLLEGGSVLVLTHPARIYREDVRVPVTLDAATCERPWVSPDGRRILCAQCVETRQRADSPPAPTCVFSELTSQGSLLSRRTVSMPTQGRSCQVFPDLDFDFNAEGNPVVTMTCFEQRGELKTRWALTASGLLEQDPKAQLQKPRGAFQLASPSK